ncbi:MAG TPA: SurA N-terminal domain-containing protein [Patescibacteria group bacterium]|nr:SurA N-terminal domain-containing protein [Patescibacteria group bacterium]
MFRRIVVLAAVLAVVCLGAGCGLSPPPGPNVWAMVNGHPILRQEVDRFYRSQMDQPQQPSPEEEALLKLNILDELINNELLWEQARKLGVEATDSEVEQKFAELKLPFSEQEFQRQLDQRGLTVDQLRSELRESISIQKLINREIVSKITVSEKEIAAAYQRDRNAYNIAEPEYHVAEIVVTPRRDKQVRNRKNDDATTPQQARRKIRMLLDRLRAGAGFSKLAMDYSEDPMTASTGGDLGFIPESALNQGNPLLKRAVLALRPGQISGIIQLKDSFRIIKLIARLSPGERKLSDPQVQQSIRSALRDRKEQVLRAAYLASLRSQAHVTNYLARDLLRSGGKLPAETQAAPPAHAAPPAARSPSPAPGPSSGIANPPSNPSAATARSKSSPSSLSGKQPATATTAR